MDPETLAAPCTNTMLEPFRRAIEAAVPGPSPPPGPVKDQVSNSHHPVSMATIFKNLPFKSTETITYFQSSLAFCNICHETWFLKLIAVLRRGQYHNLQQAPLQLRIGKFTIS
jgi:hypothetical protein